MRRQTDRQADRQTGRQTDRQTGRQTDNRQTNKKTTDRHTNKQNDQKPYAQTLNRGSIKREFTLKKWDISEVIAIFWTIRDPPGFQGLNKSRY